MKIRKVFAVALIAAICLSLYFVYAPASAEDLALTAQDGLCVHHPEHTVECGYYVEAGEAACAHVHDAACSYVEPVEGQSCTHVHDAACGYVEAREAVPCDQGCTDLDGDSVIDHGEGCAYQPAVEEQPCTHVHDETCGYVEAVEGQSCTHIHDDTCGYVDPSETGVCVYAQAGCPFCVVDWQWSDPQGFLTQEADGSWSMNMPGVSASNPISAAALQSFLPTEIATRMDNDTMPALAIAWDLTAIPADGATSGDYLLQAYLADPTYALTDAAAPLQVTLRLGGAETLIESIPSGNLPYADKIVTGVSPAGTTINLFDYWITDQFAADNTDDVANRNKGINANHALLFTFDKTNRDDVWNQWTGSKVPYPGIVANELDNGYPKLNLDMTNASDATSGRNGNESLAYLFDPKLEHQGKQSFSDVKGLLQVDSDGYYYYNSTQNYAVYYSDTNSFMLYKYPGVVSNGASGIVGQFFPFNQATEDATYKYYNPQGANKEHQGYHTLMNWTGSDSAQLNHYFGLHMSTRFIQENGGRVSSAEDAAAVTYEFSGDDDVWIFIDDKLVADLGGIHDAASVKIDFSTGKIWINDQLQSERLGKILGYQSDTLPDNTYYTLDFFLLERGNVDSNMSLKYNLITIPESSVIKVDQIGDPVPGATFSLYAADNLNDAIATGTTDANGEFVFLKSEAGDERPITIQELYDAYKNVDEGKNSLILKETSVPLGYRSNGDIGLRFYKTKYDEVLLLSNSTWDKGAYAMPKVTTTVRTGKIDLLGNGTSNQVDHSVTLNPEEKPLMFAVVFQKQEDNTWRPVSGDPLNGWKVQADGSWPSILAAARNNPYIFQLASSGAYQVEVSNLPGEITKYYYICGDEETAEYTIAYYYTEASTLSAATENNTRRIASDNNELDRVFSVNLYVSNIKNRLLVQKVDEEGNPVAGAEFALYKKDRVELDDDNRVISTSGEPYAKVETSNSTGIDEFTGGAVFPIGNQILEKGEYYLVETSAPIGYKKSELATHIVVDNTGVYADAGKANDGIEVLRGVGSIMRSMLQFAADDDVDTTLHDIKATLASRVTYQDGTIQWDQKDETIWDKASNQVLHLQFEKGNALLDYGASDNQPRALVTDVGWSKLLVRQCTTHTGTNTGVKQDLKNQDITNLFSGTVTVRVENQRVGNLTISKSVEAAQGQQLPDLSLDYTFQFTSREGSEPISGTFDATLVEADQTKIKSEIKIENGSLEIKLKDGESLTIWGLPYGSAYTVTEVLLPGYDVSHTTSGQMQNSTTASGSIPHHTVEGASLEVAYKNVYDGQLHVSLQGVKTLLGRSLAKSDNFTFTLAPHEETEEAITNGEVILPQNRKATLKTSGAEKGTFAFDNITINCEDKEQKTYKFIISEDRPNDAKEDNGYLSGGIVYDPHEAIATVTVTYNIENNDYEATVTYDNSKASSQTDATNTDRAAFTNVGAYDLTIAKKVTGEMGDRDKPFTFQISVLGMANQTLSYTGGTWEGAPADVQPPSGDSLALNEKGEATFTLSHGQTITIQGLPVGTEYTITEPDAQEDGYTVTPKGDVTCYLDGHCVGNLKQETTVTFINSKGTAVPTGIRLDALPWLLALLCGLAGCTALCVSGKTRRRKGGCGRTHG